MKKRIHLVFWCIYLQAIFAQAALYGVTNCPTPVLNRPTFSLTFGGADKKTVKTDHCGQLRDLEFIALPATVFNIKAKILDGKNTIYHVDTTDYPTPTGASLYVDSRFVEIQEEKPLPRRRSLPSQAAIITTLKNAVGAPYVWGGNIQGGVGDLLELFYDGDIPSTSRQKLILAGLDCSGLLYQATDGWTPRNTSQLLSFGNAVPVAGKSILEIIKSLEPLDLIVWNGHVIIVLNRETTIESRLECGKQGNGGVVTTSLQKRLTEIMRFRHPVNNWPISDGKPRDIFVVRRWFFPTEKGQI